MANDPRVNDLLNRVEVLEKTIERIRRLLSGDEGEATGDAAKIRDLIIEAITIHWDY